MINFNNQIASQRGKFQAFPFHLVEQSPWPLATSFTLLTMALGAVAYFQGFPFGGELLLLGFVLTASVMILWFKDIVIERTYLGDHTSQVQSGISLGFILFVLSEVMAFLSVFWAFFHSSLAPTIEIGGTWPPVGIESVDAFAIPLLNTILLLSSGAFVTWGHHALIKGDRFGAIVGTFITIILALIFTGLQAFEYMEAPFSFADSVFGTVFYASTGLHGLHVIVGTIFLTVAFIRIVQYHYTDSHHAGFESAILYWHFVDVVWIFLYIFVYVWAS
ncbi:Cytochrome c oxidase subunit 3 (mitochondrion) [Serendipita indica DSM 11827]|uniref:Cytochrome c oxidase subunit 3 n=1 Tax=Serendipita indica (strain DSM 11827) TaxID=1109443 RepID=G4U3F0_SERID|nr:Cytochrome c oxidase subunit 3 [Serendipita indica DSM 11827]